jgi:hypothetical protein
MKRSWKGKVLARGTGTSLSPVDPSMPVTIFDAAMGCALRNNQDKRSTRWPSGP